MKKRTFSSIFFIILSLGICLFVANEYLKRVEVGAINRYLGTLQSELGAHKIALNFAQIACAGFIKHTCKSGEIVLDSANFGLDLVHKNAHKNAHTNKIILRDASLAITDLSTRKVAVQAKIGDISQNLILLPKHFAYTLGLEKVDSALGYVVIERAFDFSVGGVTGRVNLAVLVRDKRFANKSILFLLKEWFDADTPSFYEYSLERLEVDLEARGSVDSALQTYLAQNLASLDVQNPHLKPLLSAITKLANNGRKKLHFRAKRKNADLVFFHTLSDIATRKKMSEISEILASIDENYQVILE